MTQEEKNKIKEIEKKFLEAKTAKGKISRVDEENIYYDIYDDIDDLNFDIGITFEHENEQYNIYPAVAAQGNGYFIETEISEEPEGYIFIIGKEKCLTDYEEWARGPEYQKFEKFVQDSSYVFENIVYVRD